MNHSLHYPAVETPSDVIVGGDLTASSHKGNALTSKCDVTNEQLSDDNTEDLLDGVQELTAAHMPTSGADTDDDISVGSAEFGLIPEADPFRTHNGRGVIEDLDLTDCIAATNHTEPSSESGPTNYDGSKRRTGSSDIWCQNGTN